MKKIDGLLCGVRGEDTLDTLKFSSSDFIDPYAKLGTNLSTKEHHKNSRLRNGASYEKYFTIRIDPGVSNYFNRPWNKEKAIPKTSTKVLALWSVNFADLLRIWNCLAMARS